MTLEKLQICEKSALSKHREDIIKEQVKNRKLEKKIQIWQN